MNSEWQDPQINAVSSRKRIRGKMDRYPYVSYRMTSLSARRDHFGERVNNGTLLILYGTIFNEL